MAAKTKRAQAATRSINDLPPPIETQAAPAPPTLQTMEHADARSAGPQIIDQPKCSHCGSMQVEHATTQGVLVSGRRWLKQKYRCRDHQCKGRRDLSIVMRPDKRNAPLVAGDEGEARKVDLTQHPAETVGGPRRRSTVRFATGT